MIRIIFKIQNEFIRIEIKDREIFYSDKVWTRAIRLIPPDVEFKRKILMSRNKIPSHIADLFSLTKEEQEEYDSATTTKELADICISDIQKKGGVLVDLQYV